MASDPTIDTSSSRRPGRWRRTDLAVLALITLAYIVTVIPRAHAKPFWHDEIYTIVYSGLPSLGQMWAAACDGLDLAPPLNAWTTRLVHRVAPVGPVATRVPPMIGFLIAIVTVFVVVRSRSGLALAAAAAMFPMYTAAYRYAYEARPYGLMLGLFAVALHSWAEADAGRRRHLHLPLLALSLAAGAWNHYYGVFVLVPIGAGELVRLVRAREVDRGMWTAIAAAGLITVPLARLFTVARSQSGSFWSPAKAGELWHAYGYLLEPMSGARFQVAALAISALGAAALMFRKGYAKPPCRIPSHEVCAGLASLLVPALMVVAALATKEVFVERYALAGVVGFSIVVPLALSTIRSKRLAAGAAAMLCMVLAASLTERVYGSLVAPPRFPNPVRSRPLLTRRLGGPEPVVVTGGLMFLQLWYYTPPPLQAGLVYIADPAAALHYVHTDTIDRGFLVLRRWAPVNVVDYNPFVAEHRTFEVYAAGSGWLLTRLRDVGATLDETGSELGAPLYRAGIPGPP